MSWSQRLLLLAGLVLGGWLLGSTAEARADSLVEVEINLPGIHIGLDVELSAELPALPVVPAPRVDVPPAQVTPPAPPVTVAEPAPVVAPLAPRVVQPAPVQAEAPPAETAPPAPAKLVPAGGCPPHSGLTEAPSAGTQLPAALTAFRWPATGTAAPALSINRDVRLLTRADDPTFSPD